MDIDIFKYNKQANKQRLIEYLNDQTEQDLEDVITRKLDDYHAAHDIDTVLLLRAIFQAMKGSPIEGDENQGLQRRFLVVKCVIQWLSKEEKHVPEKPKQASSAVNLILPQIELFPIELLRVAGKLVTDIIKEGNPIQLRLLDVLSKIWNILVAADQVDEADDIFQDLMQAKWHHQLVVGMASTLNDIELTNKQLETALICMIKKLADIEIEEVPPYTWQLLLISRKQLFWKGFKKLVLTGILNFFNQTTKENLSRVEGTVMLHISFALKQDQELGTELVKIIKNDKTNQLELFNVACLLTAARIHRLQDTIFDLFKASIVSIYKDSDRLDKCYWISEFSPLDAAEYGQVFLDVVETSASAGWDQVIQSLTQLAMIFIDTAANANAFFTAAANSNGIKTRSSGTKEEGPMEKVASLGVEILLRLFKYHDVVRSEILEQITSRIVSRSASVMDFLELLACIIREYPESVEKYMSNIKDTLDILSFLPLSTAERLLRAIQPLSKTNDQFRDGLILILRKSLFAKDLDGREMAVRGFLNILKEQLTEIEENGDSAQALAAQGVAFEILGLLRRCFSQQCEIRTCVYNGLGSLCQEFPAFAGDIFDLLNTQFLRTFERDSTVLNPIKLEACVENATSGGYPKIAEPIHILLSNLVKSLRVAATVDVTSVTAEAMSKCRDTLLSFINRLSKASLEDFELDKTANFDMATHAGLRNNQYATLLLGVYEVSLEHVFLTNDITVQSSEILLTLFKKRTGLVGLLKEVSTAEKGRKVTHINHTSCVSLEFTSKMFQSIFSAKDTKDENEGSKRDIRSNLEFANFLVTSTYESLKQAVDDIYCQRDDEYFNCCVIVCRIYMSVLEKEDSNSTYANQQSTKKQPSVLGAIAASLLNVFTLVSHVWPDRLVQLLNALIEQNQEQVEDQDMGEEEGQTPSRGNKPTNLVILELIFNIKRIVSKYLNGSTPIYKETIQIMQVASFLCKKLEKRDQDYLVRTRHIVSWLNNLTQMECIEDASLARDVIALFLRLCSNVGEFDVIQKICEDVHLTSGDLEVVTGESSVMDTSVTYQIINSKTVTIVTSKLFEFIDASYDDLTWGIGRLKLCAADDDAIDNMREFESKICKRLTSLQFILSELVKSNLQGVHAESLFKTLAKAYKTLHTLVKYKIAYPTDISDDFINVISKSGTEITDRMYKFLTVYGQQQQSQTHQEARSKKKGKKKEVNQKQKLKIQRESKMIPNLIFAVEQFERYLIQLSRKSKFDFMQYMKRSTSRDFRIQLNFAQQASSSDEEDDEDEDNGKKRSVASNSHSASSSAKRARTD
ncbi:Fanconi anemia group I protein [Mucor ambiguus]|uniref:Fanconi anemia group I protein n=1 Tax=Mucor ambiguus TaxID=91626 RepID=A0A0C9M3P9_9FUNG|nr:Fanconi anemia group I protein [Mucor ambiguus]